MGIPGVQVSLSLGFPTRETRRPRVRPSQEDGHEWAPAPRDPSCPASLQDRVSTPRLPAGPALLSLVSDHLWGRCPGGGVRRLWLQLQRAPGGSAAGRCRSWRRGGAGSIGCGTPRVWSRGLADPSPPSSVLGDSGGPGDVQTPALRSADQPGHRAPRPVSSQVRAPPLAEQGPPPKRDSPFSPRPSLYLASQSSNHRPRPAAHAP